jgi:hypothetical protein
MAQFDGQHFGVYNQYDGEGRLIRRIRETERGLRTVQETQYHTPLATRDYAKETITPSVGRIPDADYRFPDIDGGTYDADP